MKRIIATILIATIATAFAQKIDEKEIFRIDIDAYVPHGIIIKDELGSPIVHIDMIRKKFVRIIEFRKTGRQSSAVERRVTVNAKTGRKSLSAADIPGQIPIYACNTREGEIGSADFGYFGMTLALPFEGEGLASPNVTLVGTISVEWDVEKKRYITIEGCGRLAGLSYPTRANNNIESASVMVLSPCYPAYGTFTIKRVNYTNDEIIDVLTK